MARCPNGNHVSPQPARSEQTETPLANTELWYEYDVITIIQGRCYFFSLNKSFFVSLTFARSALLKMATEIKDAVTLTTRGKIAIITFNLEKKLNALTQDLYYRLSCLMREIAARDDIFITILTGKGRYFSAYILLHSLSSHSSVS